MSTTRASVPLVAVTPVQRAIASGTTPLAVDEEGIPRLLVARDALHAGSASEHVARLAPSWGVRSGDVPQLATVGEVAVLGGTVSRLRQLVDGVPVDGGELRVMTRADGTLVAASGLLRSTGAPREGASWSLGETGAIARALRGKYGVDVDAARLVAKRRTKDATIYAGRWGNLDLSLARAREVWYAASRSPDAPLAAAWVVEAYASAEAVKTTAGDAFRMVIANDGRVLAERNLVVDAEFTYRVFAEPTGERHPFDGPMVDSAPHPTGQPDGLFPSYAASTLVAVDGLNHPSGGGAADPWLPADRTETYGNNVAAYADFNAPDGLTTGDFRATTTGARTFDRAYDPTLGPMASPEQQMAGITALFFTINWLHDFWYDGGFTEAAGNAQESNYGRGGDEGDAINAEAQDNALGGSRNNANMSTPDDGLSPRMQVFLWSGKETRTLTLGTRAAASGSASFGPKDFELTAPLAVADDGMGTGSDACTALPAMTGQIVLVDRGSCTFKTKTLNVQNAGGVGVLLANNTASSTPPGLADDAMITTAITIPTLSILQTEGTQLKADVAAGALDVTMRREVGVELEGTLDASVVSHEYGHYLHHRLSACSTPACGAMSEGWGDFTSLMVSARAGDNLMSAYPVGVYSTQSYSADAAYFGIRRAPYSANHDINDLSFRHMTNGVATPTTHPFQVSGPNAEVHNAGEVWASMLWEGYVALQQAGTSFDDVRAKMRSYVVAGLLLAPVDGTPTEIRDALLTAARASSQADHDTLVAAFARRGFGSCAVSAPRTSSSFMGIVESNEVKGNAVLGAAELATVNRCDSDLVLDAGETGRITLPIANTGPEPLTNVVATLTTTTAGVTVTSQPVMLGTIAGSGSATATFEVAVADSVTAPTAADFTITVTSDVGCTTKIEVPAAIAINTDDRATSSATDTFDAMASVWTTPASGSAWSQKRPTPLDGIWFGADGASRGDSSITSPALTADAAMPVTITFSHAFSFEYSQNQYFDGGVLEISRDNGATWEDIATLVATSPYNATLTTQSDNPLGGRAAFGRTNASYPDPDTVTLDLGTQLAGQTFQLRFRVVTDGGTGGAGWEIDDVALTGISGTPFPTLVADPAGCGVGPDGGMPEDEMDEEKPDGGGCCQSQRSAGGSWLLALGVLGLLARGRSRR
ncbi:MAG: M36 family metallopeptidase [Myxococcales bacterium]|nr:M36 family metallopeptidase [Myxococcales bacterium]